MKPKPLLPRMTLALLLPVILLSLAACGNKSEAPAPNSLIALPKTGQTTCYSTSGTPTDCAGTGHDGSLQTGVAWPNPRFVVGTGATAGCVTDNLTGLMWTQNANLRAGRSVWPDALTYANGLTLCGFNDWRLPNRNELFSLINHGESNNSIALTALGFSNLQADYYWSSSNYVNVPTSAWVVHMGDSNLPPTPSAITSMYKYSNLYVWPVRAGQ